MQKQVRRFLVKLIIEQAILFEERAYRFHDTVAKKSGMVSVGEEAGHVELFKVQMDKETSREEAV